MSVSPPLRLRPLEIGDLLDETFRMYRRHFVLFAGISAILSMPSAALFALLLGSFSSVLQQSNGTLTDVSFVTPAMFVENIGLGAAMGRSWRLVEGRWWRTFLILFLMVILWWVVQIALGAFLQLGQVLLQLFVSPFLAAAIAAASGQIVGAVV